MKDEKKMKKDMVIRPDHYRRYGMESIDAMRGTMSPEEFNGFLRATPSSTSRGRARRTRSSRTSTRSAGTRCSSTSPTAARLRNLEKLTNT